MKVFAKIIPRRTPPVQLIIGVLMVLSAISVILPHGVRASVTLRVGIFQNKPIVYFEDGAKGLFVDILDYVAKKEGWQIEYVRCNLGDCLDLLESNQLDLMTSIGQSPQRIERFLFSKEPVWTFWGTVYSIDANVNSILDLADKKIAVRKANKTTAALKKMLADFNIQAEYVEFDDYDAAFGSLQDGVADMVAVNNSYAFSAKNVQSRLYQTPIVFNPFSAYFAASKNGKNDRILERIDHYVRELKSDSDSLYQSFTNRWFGLPQQSYWTAKRLGIGSGLMIIFVIVVMAFWRYRSLVEMNEKLKRSVAQVEESEKKLEKQSAQLIQAQKMESIGRLAGGVAHDLNNLLTPILGYSEMLREEAPPDDPIHDSLNEILTAGTRAKDLVSRLLAFSRKQVMELTQTNLNSILDGIQKLLRRTITEDIQFEVFLTHEELLVTVDERQIELVILNLCVNAADAMPGGGKITIETMAMHVDGAYAELHNGMNPGDYARLVVSDTGSGMDEETLEHIFEPFFSTKGDQGTGLGLAMAYGIVKQHEGHILVYSEPDIGSSFTIYLPLTAKMAGEKKSPETSVSDLTGSETILLVEDNEQVRALALAILRRKGYQVITAENGQVALGKLAQSSGAVHLLLTDVVMPIMNGKELFAKAVQKRPGLKVLFMSGYPANVIAHHGVLDQNVNYIEKPFSMEKLAAKVRESLDNNQTFKER